jgi:hypothetical protein
MFHILTVAGRERPEIPINLNPSRAELSRVFSHAAESFQRSLSPKEQSIFKKFSTSSEMLKDLYDNCKDVQNKSKISRLCQKIEKFATAWEPFFEITSIFVSSHPEFAGIIWGAIRLVFMV